MVENLRRRLDMMSSDNGKIMEQEMIKFKQAIQPLRRSRSSETQSRVYTANQSDTGKTKIHKQKRNIQSKGFSEVEAFNTGSPPFEEPNIHENSERRV